MGDFVELSNVDETIVLDIIYATKNNFTGIEVYSEPRCFLRKKTAEKLKNVQKELLQQECCLKVFDGYRPLSVQKIFWDHTPNRNYVADPAVGSKHNRGAAVDVTIIDKNTLQEWQMPTDIDAFTPLAHRDCFDLPQKAIDNREFLEKVMKKHGFIGLPTEWWHFDDEDWEEYPICDYTFEELSQNVSVH